MRQYEDDDLDRANWLHGHGMCLEYNMIELAKRIYAKRQSEHNTGENAEPLVSGDRK